MAAVGHQRQVQQQQQSLSQQTTQLEFHQAMRDFKTMFPEMDEDVIEVVLRANQGAVDATIDQLLAMSTDNENERLRTEMDATENAEAPPGYSPTTPPPTYQQAVPYSQLAATVTATAAKPTDTGSGAATPSSSSTSAACPADTGSSTSGTRNPPPHPGPASNEGDGGAAVPADDPLGSAPTGAVPPPKSVIPLRVAKNWSPPILGPLPCDFLRICTADGRVMNPPCMDDDHSGSAAEMEMPATSQLDAGLSAVLCSKVIQQKILENRRQRKLGNGEDPELTQYLEDERIALFLQNEEFMSELRSNKDFLTTLERDSKSRKSDSSWQSAYDSDDDSCSDGEEPPPKEVVGPFPCTKASPAAEESDADFREKLKNMGKLSRRKFAQLARLFSRQKKRSAKQMYPYARLSEGSMPSKDNLLLDENDEAWESDDDSTQPQNEYHLIKNSSSPSEHSGFGPCAKTD